MRAARHTRLNLLARIVALVLLVLLVTGVMVSCSLSSRSVRDPRRSSVVPGNPQDGVTKSLESSVPIPPKPSMDEHSSNTATVRRGITSYRNRFPFPASEVGAEVLTRYRDQQCWELVVSDILDLSGAAWGAIFQKNDGSEIAFLLALPTVLGREPGPENPTILSEVLIDVEAQRQAIAGD